MSTKLADLAEKLKISQKELKEKIKTLGFKVAPRARTIDEETATLIFDELKPKKAEKPAAKKVEPKVTKIAEAVEEIPEAKDVAEIYDQIIEQQQQREIIKSQRKKTAGKIDQKKKESEIQVVTPVIPSSVEIGDYISVKEFAEKTGIKLAKIIGELMKNGILANINQQIDFDTAQIIADDMGVKIRRTRSVAGTEEFMTGDISKLLKEDDSSLLVERPPVVCVMGHVDHGKTKLLDAIRNTDVVSGESGGITQHIGAYQVTKKGKSITFLDTPGHEAFTAMRARGAKATDIAILVVAADEGVKPQTVEAINHAKEAHVPVIVALNKMDKPGVNPDRVKGELSEHGLQAEDWGGDTVMVPISALKGEGIDELLDLVILTADMQVLKANPNREAVGTVIEANLNHSLGPVATILVNTGTLKVSDYVIVGKAFGRIKLMRDYTGKAITKAPPSTPVLIAGLNQTPRSGDILQVVPTEKIAKQRAEEINLLTKKEDYEKSAYLNQVLSQMASDKVLKILIKADTKGSLEAIKQSIAKIKDEDVAIKIIHGGVGNINESDIMMASASKGIALGFHTKYDSPHVETTAEREGVEVRFYKVIYDLIEDLKKFLSGLIAPEIIEVITGRLQVKQLFFAKKKEAIIGCKVLSGKVKVNAKIKVIRGKDAAGEDKTVGEGTIMSLKKVSEPVKEISEGNDCGIKFSGIPILEGDILEAYEKQEKRRTIS